VLSWIQQQPFIIDVSRQPEATPDISLSVVLAAFAMAGVALLVAAVGGLVVGAVFVAIRRFRDTASPPANEHLRLRI
jgi:hypothetical protein